MRSKISYLKTPLNQSELEELSTVLKAMETSVSYLHGLSCAVISSPMAFTSNHWQEWLYSGFEFKSMEQAEKVIGLVVRFYNWISDQLRHGQFKPFLYRDPGSDLAELDIAQEWSAGYLDGADLDPLWGDLMEEDEEMNLAMLPYEVVAGYADLSDGPETLPDDDLIKEHTQQMYGKLEWLNRTFYNLWQAARKEYLHNDMASGNN